MAAPVVVSIPHQLGRAEARRRLEAMMADMAAQVPALGDFTQAWSGDRLNFETRAMGQTITGFADVADDSVRLEMRLPGFLGMMAGQLKDKIQRRGTLLLEGPKS